MKKKLTQFTIDTKHWLRGNWVPSELRNSSKNMCCLGHLAKSVGAKNEDILLCTMPENAIKVKWPEGILYNGRNTALCGQIISANDDAELSPQVRKSMLIKLFAKINLKPVFK